jgi:hypothetical protein
MKKTKRAPFGIIFLAVMFIALCPAVRVAAAPAERYAEEPGGYTICPPEGWGVVEVPGLKYKVIAGPRKNNFASNINFADEKYDSSLTDYVSGNIEYLKEMFAYIVVDGPKPFVTDSGVKGEWFRTLTEQNGLKLRQTFYVLTDGKGRFMAATCTTNADGGEALDGIFEASLKTFEWAE